MSLLFSPEADGFAVDAWRLPLALSVAALVARLLPREPPTELARCPFTVVDDGSFGLPVGKPVPGPGVTRGASAAISAALDRAASVDDVRAGSLVALFGVSSYLQRCPVRSVVRKFNSAGCQECAAVCLPV